MEKIIGGEEFEASFPVRIHKKLLWPCFEFIAQAQGVEDYEKNIIEEVVLRLADINVTDIKEIASCTGLEEDLISFIQSRLEQRNCLDSCCHITTEGKEKLGEYSKNQSKEIHVYVDALSGRIIPYYNMVDSDNRFKYSFGKEEICYAQSDSDLESENLIFFKYKGFSSAGIESDEMQSAMKLHYNDDYNYVPESDDVTAMLHKLFPKKDGVFARIDEEQSTKKNLCWILLDLMQPEGSSRDWVFTDGFGKIFSFFSVEFIKNENDIKYISSLRDGLKIQTNAEKSLVREVAKKYPKLTEKLNSSQKYMKELKTFVDSPDKEEALLSAISDSLLSLTQLAEWVIFYILHENKYEYKAKNVLADFEKFSNNKSSGHIISGIAKKCAGKLGFECGIEEKKSLIQRYGKLWYAFNKVPTLFALLDILLIAFADEKWLKEFARENPDFISVLTDLNISRNKSFHSGRVTETSKTIEKIEKIYNEIMLLLGKGLGIKVDDSNELSFEEKIAIQNERDEAISRMEENLGFSLCKILESSLLRFLTDMERRGKDSETLNNAIILDEYKILENIFVSVNECLGNEWKNSDWKQKVTSAGFEFSETADFKSLCGTSEDRIESALERLASSMNAACIAFCTLCDVKLLKEISSKWKSLLKDVSYIVYKRGHGEIPVFVDANRTLEIKKKIIELIKFFAKNGFLGEKAVN